MLLARYLDRIGIKSPLLRALDGRPVEASSEIAFSNPVLSFNRPVRLKQRLPSLSMPPRPVLAAVAAVGAAAATAGLVWYANRRRALYARI